MQGKCNICFLTGVNLYNMTSTELKYYQQFVFKVELSSQTKVLCVYCKSMLKRINKFAEKCQKSQDFLMDTIKLESDMIMQLKTSHNLSPCTVTYLHVGPTESDSVKKENDSEDDIPLVLLSQNGNSSEFLDDSDDHNAEESDMIMQLKTSHNLSPCTVTYLHVGPTESDSVKKENDSEDDIPLVLLSQNGNSSEFLDDSDDHNAEESDVIMQLKTSHNLSPCTVTYLHVGPTESDSVKKENDSEDDIPLVLLSQNGNSSEFLDDSDDHNAEESDMIMQLKTSHNLSPCTVTYLHVGPTESDSVKKENDSEDDIPLVLLSQNGNSSEFLDDSDDHNAEPKEDFNEKENKIGHMKEKKNKSKKGSHLKEGFSSRMVQETDEYIVIKLTKEQVLAEMQENKMADKYKMAPYKCEKCVKGFNFDDVLQAHMEKHLPKNGQFICDICTQHCPSAVSLRGHLKSHTTRYKCKVCQIVRLSRQHVLEHFALEHTDSAVSYRCTQCPYTSKKRTVMQRHVRLHSSSEPHACHQCGKLYKSRESLRVHIMRHDNSKRHQCDVCRRWFIYATQLKKHTQAVHVRRDYYCVECDVKFKSMYTLKQHFQRAKKHRDASSYKFSCSSCPQRFVSGAALATHDTRAHGAAARAACGLCERRYSCGKALRLHERRAHAPRPPPAPCPLCHRNFSRKSVLRIHMRTHTGERPHACECGASYTQPAALRAHRAAKHKNEIVPEGS